MVNKVPPVPLIPVRDPDSLAISQAMTRHGTEVAARLNNSLQMDGTEAMEAPLPLQQLATADLPPAAAHEGETLYDTTLNRLVTSDGAAWVPAASPAEIAEQAQDAVGSILTDSASIDFTYNDGVPSITAIVKPDGITATEIAAGAVGTSELADTAVTPGSYTYMSATVDQDGRLTAAASGATPATPGMVLLTSGSVSAAGVLDLPLGAYTAYRAIVVKLYAFLPATDGVDLECLFSTDNGATFITANYLYGTSTFGEVGFHAHTGATGAATTKLTSTAANGQVGNAASEGYNGSIEVLGWQLTALQPRITHAGIYLSNAATASLSCTRGAAINTTAQDLTGLRFRFSSGNIASGNYAVYGLT